MSHVSKEALWSPLDAEAEAHVSSCEECRAELVNVGYARSLLGDLPPPPPLREVSARRIEAVLFHAAEKRAARLKTHLKAEQLWAVGEVEQAHLDACAQCSDELERVQFARGLLAEPAAPPPLSDASARRIGDVLRQAAEEQVERRAGWASWWPFNFNPAWMFAPVAAALLAFAAYVLRPAPQPVAVPVATQDPVIPAPTPAPIVEAPKEPEQVALPAPAPVPAKKVIASVTSARKATVKKKQELSEGATVATSKGGALWMQLPVGVRAGLLGGSKVELKKLEEKSVTLDVTQGSLVVVARHDPTRALHVHAGELDVLDVGTRFLVSKDDKRTLVAVEEGEVEVDAPGRKVPVRAGQAVEWRDGHLSQQAWTTEEPKAAPVKTAQVSPRPKPVDDTPPIEGKPVQPPPPEQAPAAPAAPTAPAAPAAEPTASSPDEWGTPDNLKTAAANEPPPQPAPEPAVAPPPPAPTAAAAAAAEPEQSEEKQSEADETLAQRIERKLRAVANGLAHVRSREDRADDVVRLSTDGQTCNEALNRADLWLGEPVPRGEGFRMRKSVLRAKLHCLQYQGRTGDALAVQRELERL